MRAALQPQGLEDTRRRIADKWMLFLAISLAGYALAGRGYAYIGLPPFYISEVLLGLGLLCFLMTRGWMQAMRIPPAVAVLPLAVWGFFRLVPNVPEYGIDAARDAVVWAYAAFALIVATLIVAKPERLRVMIDRYRLFTKIFLLGIPVAFFVYRFGRDALPRWPWVDTSVIQVKEADVLVHLAGILAFWMADPKRSVKWFWAILLTLNMAMMGVIDRAGMVAFAAVLIICLLAKPFHGAAWRTIVMLFLGAILLYASQVDIEVPGGKGRTISWKTFVVNVQSIFGQAHGARESNKEWRLNWWADIYDYTVNGKYFWTGKGFGINLADDDGYQVQEDNSLRSPHNVHMTVLARMGVPGAVAWGLMHLTWMYSIGRSYLLARRRGHQNWAGLFLFLFAYYVAFMINGSFDVFIEGPMGGVWFWTIFGVGVASLWCYRYRRDLFADDDKRDVSGQLQQTDESARRAQLLPAAGRRRPGLPVGAGAARIARP